MRATIVLLPRAEEEIRNLPSRERRRVINAVRLLSDFPQMAQTANLADAPDVRRIVVGLYLVFYRFDAQQNIVRVFTVRHGRQKPIASNELD